MERGKPWLKNQGERGVTTVEGFVMKLEEQTTVFLNQLIKKWTIEKIKKSF